MPNPRPLPLPAACLHPQRASARQPAAHTLVTRASATTCRERKKMSVCSSTDARPAICVLLQGRDGRGGAGGWCATAGRDEEGSVQLHRRPVLWTGGWYGTRVAMDETCGSRATRPPCCPACCVVTTHRCRAFRLSTTPCISSRSRSESGSGRRPSAAMSTRCTITSA